MKFFGFPPFLMNSAGDALAGAGGGDSGGGDTGSTGSEGFSDSAGSTALATIPGGDDGQVHDAEFSDGREQDNRQVSKTARFVENGRISPTGKKALDAVRAIDPALAQRLTNELVLAARFRTEVKGGFKEIAGLRQRIEDIGGERGFETAVQNSRDLMELDRMYLASDPQFISQITTDTDPALQEEKQQAFVGLIPHALSRWAAIDPAGRSWWTANEFAKGLDSVRMPVLIARMVDILNANEATLPPALIPAFNAMSEAFESISYAAAKNKPQAPQKDLKLEDQRKQLQTAREKLTRDQWQGDLSAKRRAIFDSALTKTLGARLANLTDSQRTEIKGWYDYVIRPKAAARQAGIDRFLANGDKEGWLKTEIVFYNTEIPRAIAQAVQKFVPKAGAEPGQRTAPARQTPQQRTQPVAAGAVRVPNIAAARYNVADRRNTPELLRQNQGWGKDGKLYQWPA